MKEVVANNLDNALVSLDFRVFLDLANSAFSSVSDLSNRDVVEDRKYIDLYIKNCVYMRESLERGLERAQKESNKFEEQRLLQALEKNRLNYSYFIMLKKGRSAGRHS